MVEEALRRLYKSVSDKTNILRSDRLNLARQYGELRILNDYLEIQAERSEPVEFIKMSRAHELLCEEIFKQESRINEIDIEINVDEFL